MIIILVLGVALILWGIFPVFLMAYYSPFNRTKVVSFNASIDVRQESRRYIYVDIYWVIIEYGYIVGGKVYKSNSIGFSDGLKFQSKERAERFISKIKNIDTCLYSKRNPSKSVLLKSISVGDSNNSYPLILAGLLILVLYSYLSKFI